MSIKFAEEHILHGEQFAWKSFEEPGQVWSQWRGNLGRTERQKRAYRSVQKRTSKRIWVTAQDQAMCV